MCIRDRTFAAVKDQGATLNSQPIRTSGQTDLRQTMAMASLPVGAGADDPAVGRFLKMLAQLQTVQRSGSSAMNLACLASGRIDAFWSSSLKPWDVAAGELIVREAGGTVTKLTGEAHDIMTPSTLASASTDLQDKLVSRLDDGSSC